MTARAENDGGIGYVVCGELRVIAPCRSKPWSGHFRGFPLIIGPDRADDGFMDWITIIGVIAGAWTLLLVVTGERQGRERQIAGAMAEAAEQAKAAQKKRSVHAAVAAVAKMEAAAAK